jgi:foldase protein PrsA
VKKCSAAFGALAGALALGVALALAACGSVDSYAATVNGTTISQSSLESEMRDIAANEKYLEQVESKIQVRGSGAGTFDAAFTGQVLGRQIQYVLVDDEVARRKLKITDADLKSARDEVAQQAGGVEILNAFPKPYQDQLVQRAAKVDALTVSLAGQTATDAAARAYYDAHKSEFTTACVSHILVATKDKADQLKARIAGGEDFGAVAKAESQDATSAAANGDLGCDISTDTISVPEFINAVQTQPIGVVGDPVQTQFGFHLILVRSRTIPPFEQVIDRARDKVVIASKSKLQEWLNSAVSKAKITVNPRYGTFDRQQLAVVPPVAPSTVPPSTSPPASGIQPLPTTTP